MNKVSVVSSRGRGAAVAIHEAGQIRWFRDCRVGLRPPRNDRLGIFSSLLVKVRSGAESAATPGAVRKWVVLGGGGW
jgi:hypothetical protein